MGGDAVDEVAAPRRLGRAHAAALGLASPDLEGHLGDDPTVQHDAHDLHRGGLAVPRAQEVLDLRSGLGPTLVPPGQGGELLRALDALEAVGVEEVVVNAEVVEGRAQPLLIYAEKKGGAASA